MTLAFHELIYLDILMGVDNTHGGSFYLVDSTGYVIKDLIFELLEGDINGRNT